MVAAALVFVLVTGGILAAYGAATRLPALLAGRRIDRRLHEVSSVQPAESSSGMLVKADVAGPLPAVDRVIAQTDAGSRLMLLIEQSGTRTSPGAVVLASVLAMSVGGLIGLLVGRKPAAAFVAAIGGGVAPILWLVHRRSSRLKRFEEQFPEALDLLSRAIRAGHALQTALGMVADELPAPVGPEFKKTFDQQNFGLPLRDALNDMAERLTLLDVQFFVTAVLIQRDTGGNLSEILDNLAHVVRERFKIKRQVRVHTAHGRFTGYVLLALPAALAIVLSFINPSHMQLLFREHMGRMMLMGAVVMQAIGFVWIRRVIRIEV